MTRPLSDTSGLLLYPAYQIYSNQAMTPLEVNDVSSLPQGGRIPGAFHSHVGPRERRSITLEIEQQASLIDGLLRDLAPGSLSLSPPSLNWLVRLREQCRRRDDQEAWLRRESQLARLVNQPQFAEKFLARLNLLLQEEHLYNAARSDLPPQYLTSDPPDDPVLLFASLLTAPGRTFGLVISLEQVCSKVGTLAARSSWLPEEVQIQIHRERLSSRRRSWWRAASWIPGRLNMWCGQHLRDPACFSDGPGRRTCFIWPP